MATTISKNFKLYNAKLMFNEVVNASNNNLYFFISRPMPWSNESSPPTTIDTINEIQYKSWHNILAAKKVIVSDIAFCANRNDWSSGTTYTEYSSNSAFYNSSFFTMSSDYNVYKCIGNNGGAASTVEPSGTSTSIITTGDGYQWKFMYSISTADILKFVTSSYIPVKTLTSDDSSAQWDVQVAANNASIESFRLVSGGSNYRYNTGTAQAGSTSTITLSTGASATNGYYNGMSVYISSGTGNGQLRTILNYNGTTKVASVTSNFSTAPDGTSVYVVSPKINLTGNGSGFSGYPTVSGGAITKINILNPGQNYTQAAVTFTSNTASAATIYPNLSPKGGHGSDPLCELYGHNLLFNVSLSGGESNTFMTSNDYRTIGLILNPRLQSNNSVATGSAYDLTTKVKLVSPSGTFLKDETITGVSSGTTATVVEYANSTVLRLCNLSGSFTISETLTGSTSAATANANTITTPSLKQGTGSVLFVDNRTAIQRSSDQQEEYKIIVRF